MNERQIHARNVVLFGVNEYSVHLEERCCNDRLEVKKMFEVLLLKRISIIYTRFLKLLKI